MKNKNLSTYDEYVSKMSEKRRKKFEEGYQKFLLSELIYAIMQEDEISVRELAKLAGISPTIVQGFRSGLKPNITMQSFIKILGALDCCLIVKKGNVKFPIDLPLHQRN
jgi:hypothetical protein